MALTVEVHHEHWLDTQHDVWDALVADSGIDPLFNGALWQTLWWRCHGHALRAALHVYVVRDGIDVVAVLPTYRRTVRLKSLLAITRLEVIGSCMDNVGGGTFSEYLDAPVRPGYEARAAQLLADHIRGTRDWSDFVCTTTPTDSWLVRHLAPRLAGTDAFLRPSDTANAWGISLASGVDPWRKALDGAVRRKAFGMRKRLVQPQFSLLGAAEIPAVFAQLDAFHQARWGKPHFVGAVGRFYRDLIDARPALARPSVLLHDGRPVSALFDLLVGGREYNVQSGFAANAVPGASLGYLHLGYSIEAAASAGVAHFDLLGGGGKQREYKRDLALPMSAMRLAVHVVRSPPLAALYRWRDRRSAADRHGVANGESGE